ncbi:MAG: amidohydrolase family protein [Candidatus Humimicrobiaceae bacterium]
MKRLEQYFSYTEEDLRIFNDELMEFLPERIIDSHVHLWNKEFFKSSISPERLDQNPFLDLGFESFSFEEFKTIKEKLFPAKEYNGIFFGLPLKEMDLDKNNDYIQNICKANNTYGLYVPDSNLKKIPADFFAKRFIGFKPYPDLVEYGAPKDFSKLDIDVSIFDFVSRNVLEFSEEYGLILLLHIPGKDRLNDKRNIEEIRTIGTKYPNIKIILAHAGRSYCYEDIRESINYIKDINNLYVDTAMINNVLVLKVLLEEIGAERIIYGSDFAVAALRGKNVDINNKHYFVTDTPKNWSLSSSYMKLDSFTFFVYEIIRAIKRASCFTSTDKEKINNIFYGNIKRLIDNITAS